jgi:serine/threonine-protein kinase
VVESVRRRLSPASGTVGQHHLIATLGHGGMADVYLAIRKGPVELAKLLVIKRMRPELAEDPEFVAMFVDEARLAVRLNHPNVVHTTEVDEFAGSLYLAMEYLDGQPLSLLTARAHRHGGLSVAVAVRVVSDVLAGLHHAHELRDYDGTPLRIVHRDVTPGNVFVTYDGQVKLVDFGIAKAAVRAAQTQVGMLKGKAGYMAPEQMAGREVDARTDVFSAGVVLWELLADRRLFDVDGDVAMHAVIIDGAPLLRTVRHDIPAELERICAKALSRELSQRYASAAEMQEDLERAALVTRLRSSTREIGELMMRVFPGERGAMRALIERRIGELRSVGELTLTATKTLSRSSSSKRLGRLPSKPALDSVPPEPTSVSMRPAATIRKRRRRRVVALVAAGAGVAMGLLATVRYLGLHQQSPVAEPGTSSDSVETTNSAPRAAEAQSPITIRIVASPSDAQILLDGAELSGNPFSGRFPRDGGLHNIEVRADGYQSRTHIVDFASDVQLIVTLDKLARADDGGGRSPPPLPAAPSARTPPAASKARAIDTSDPWR